MVGQDSHLTRIQREGQSYLKTALASNVSGDERGNVVSAALRHLNRKSKRTSVSNASQTQSAYLSQNSAAQSTRTSSFLNTLAEALDFEIPVPVLIRTAEESAKLKALPVLTKCLSILAKKDSVGTAGRDNAGGMTSSPMKKRKAGNGTKRKSKKSKRDPDADEGDDDDDDNIEEEEDDDDDAPHTSAKGRTGQAFVDDFITKLVCFDAYRGNSSEETDFVFMASSAREAPLSESTTRTILMSMNHRMRSVPVFELPAFVYQMLLLASAKGNLNLKKLFLVSLAQQFQRIESKAKSSQLATQSLVDDDEDAIVGSSGPTLDEIHQVQGTTLFHIEYALKQDPALVSELVKLARSTVESQAQFMAPFGIAILMSVARSPSIQDELLGRMHESLVKFGKERTLREVNLFASRVTGKDEPLVKPSESLLEAASRTGWNGWEEIAEPMLRFANLLLDKPIPTERSLPGELLRVLFGAQSKMRKSILEQIVTRIALREKSTTDVITVLSDLARNLPIDIMELSSYLRQCIEECVQLPPILAESLINALKPLLRSRRDLLDYYFIVMRKALFHHNKNNRAVASLGFLNILGFRNLENNPTGSSNRRRRSSQGSRSARNRITDDDVARIKAACQPLRRTMSHPPALKALLYKQIGSFVTQLSEDSEREAVCLALKDLLRPQFLKYVSAKNAPHLHLDFCVDESSGGSLIEPLGNLIQCLSTIDLSLSKDRTKESYIMDLARKVAAVSLDDFAISKDAVEDIRPMDGEELEPEQLATNAAAKANRVRARVLGNVADSLISASLEHAVDSGDRKIIIDVAFPLLLLREKTMDVLKVLGCTSASDAIRDLSGDASIEAGHQAVPIRLRGNKGKSSGAKKPGKGGKGAGKSNGKQNSDGTSGGTSSAPSDYRLGAFSIMFSGFTVPIVPLRIAAKCLDKITKGSNDSDPLSSYFSSKRKERDVIDLHAYLLAVAGQHLQNSNNKSGTPYSIDSDSVCSMASIALRNVGLLKDDDSPDILRYILLLGACAKTLTTAFSDDEEVFEKMMTCLLPEEEDGSDPEYDGMLSDFSVLGQLEDLIGNFLERTANKEAAELLHAYRYFTKCIEQYSKTLQKKNRVRVREMQWARKLLNANESADEASVRSLTTLAFLYAEDNNDMRAIEQVVDRIHVVIGDIEAHEESPLPTLGHEEDSLSLAVSIRRPTSLTAAESVLDGLDIGLDDVEWCLSRMNSLEAVANAAYENLVEDTRKVPVPFVKRERDREKKAAADANRAEDAALTRGQHVVNNLSQLLNCAIAKWALQERVLQCAIRAYKYSTIATNAQLKRKGNPRTSFVDLIEKIKILGPILWTFVSFMGTEAGRDNSTKGVKKSAKEARIMPNLIYEVESFEKSLIALQKVTKGHNFLKNFKRNTARDYRIQESKMSEVPDAE